MELNEQQYQLLREPIERYRFSNFHGFKVWNETDIKKGIQVLAELGIPDPSVGCDVCNDSAYSKAVFGQLDTLFTQYESN